MEGSNTITRGKRSLEGDDEQQQQQPDRKRPALASVIVEALKMDSLQRLCSSLEPILRRVVSEEVERALAKLGPARLSGRSSPKRIEGPDGRNLQLHFKSQLSLPLFTGGKVEGEQGAAIHVVLVDANTGHVVTTGPESSVKLDIVVLEGDFNNEDGEDWTQEEFVSHEVKEREGKRPLLNGELQLTIKEGVGTIGKLTFTDNSSWIRSRKFRLGLKVTSSFCQGVRIREAKTEAFTVKDHRGELYKKHYPPALNDEVWRLEKIGKDGSFHKRLTNAGIFTMEDFLRLVVKDSQRLRSGGMSNKMWEALMEHAKTCVLTEKLYVYHPDDTRNTGMVFNNIYQLIGLITGEHYYIADSLSDGQKVYVDTMVKKAYDNWNQVVEYDGKSLLSFKQTTRSSASTNEPLIGQIDYSNALEPQIPMSRTISLSDKPPMDPGLTVGGYNDNGGSKFASAHPINSHTSDQFYTAFSNGHEQLIINPQHTQTTSNDSDVGLALGPPQSSALGFEAMSSSVHQPNLNLFDENWTHIHDKGVDELLSEEDIRIRSHEMLENEDMQQLLRLFSMNGHGSINMPDDGFSFPSYVPAPSPTFSYDEDRNRPGGKAVVGWLKIKAAMRWGFFIRKKAAEKRAQLVELDD